MILKPAELFRILDPILTVFRVHMRRLLSPDRFRQNLTLSLLTTAWEPRRPDVMAAVPLAADVMYPWVRRETRSNSLLRGFDVGAPFHLSTPTDLPSISFSAFAYITGLVSLTIPPQGFIRTSS